MFFLNLSLKVREREVRDLKCEIDLKGRFEGDVL